MTYATVKEVLGLTDGFDWLAGGWQAADNLWEVRRSSFLDDAVVEGACRELGFADELRKAVLGGLPSFRGQPELLRLAWQFHWWPAQLVHEPDLKARVDALTTDWPTLPSSLSELARRFYVYVFLASVQSVFAINQQRGIDDEITRATLGDLELWVNDFTEKWGAWGLEEQNWVKFGFSGRLFQLGRLQFMLEYWLYDYHVFRNRDGDDMSILAGEAMRFRKDGQCDGVNGIHDTECSWTAHFQESPQEIVGHPIADDSRALQEPTRLAASDWEEVLRLGDPVLGVHIPTNGPLTAEACAASYDWARQFFTEYFPDHSIRALTCDSWLLDAQLAAYLPTDTRIMQFQKGFRLVPNPIGDQAQTIERVLGQTTPDPATAPRETSLQRIVAEHLEKGKRWRRGLGLRIWSPSAEIST